MVKNQYVRVEYNRLKHCTSNGMLDVATGDPVWKWRIFEIFCPKSLNSEVSNFYLPEFWAELKT